MPLPTTRYARYLYRRDRYLRRMRKRRLKKWHTHKIPGVLARVKTLKNLVPLGPKQSGPGVSSRSYNAMPALNVLPYTYVVSDASGYRPPHVRITGPLYLFLRALGRHQRVALIRFHAKRVHCNGTHIVVRRSTARDRQITGCNYFYFFNQCFRDTDVLGRHPNETDVAGGVPSGPSGWPVPLGY